MLRCKYPYFNRAEKIPVPCGRCFFCRQRKRAQWTARLMMENYYHDRSVFLTLTFADEHLPNPPFVSKRDLQLFFKRFRKLVSPRKIRYYACGEYGEKRGRPHYHAILFNVSFEDLHYVEQAWPFGRVQLDRVEAGSIAYVAGYVSKKFIHSKEFEVTGEVKEKEFALMSRRPALGSDFLNSLIPYAFSQNPFDVVQTIQIGDRSYSLDRTMRDKLRKLVMSDEEVAHIKKLGKAVYAEKISDCIAEAFGSSNASNYLEFFHSEDPKTSDLLYYEDLVGRTLDLNFSALEAEERIKLRRHNRKDL